jgi:hypothetical protein
MDDERYKSGLANDINTAVYDSRSITFTEDHHRESNVVGVEIYGIKQRRSEFRVVDH